MKSGRLRKKAKNTLLKDYLQAMKDYISSSEDDQQNSNYSPQVNLRDSFERNSTIFESNQSISPKECQFQGEEIDFETLEISSPSFNEKKELQEQLQLESQLIKHPHGSKKQEKIEQQSKQEPQYGQSKRKKNKFLSKQFKKRLQYDIKYRQLALPQLIQKYGISRSTVKRYLSQINTFGEIVMPKGGGRVVSGSKQNKIAGFIQQKVSANPFLSQKQMVGVVKEQLGLTVSQQTISLILRSSNITKKKGMVTYREGNADENINRRYHYAVKYQTLDTRKVIFLDQTGFNQCFQGQYGYAPRGKRLLREKYGRSGHKIVVILSMTFEGLCHWDIVDLSVKTQHVAAYIKKYQARYRGYTLILDNARVHRTQQVAQAARSIGLQLLFLPPYTPQLNPIQLVFARLKSLYKANESIKLENPQTQLAEKVQGCLTALSKQKLNKYQRPVNFWIQQALLRKKFNEVDERQNEKAALQNGNKI